MNDLLERAKQIWRSFSAQPGNTHVLLAASLLLGLAMVLTFSDDGHSQGSLTVSPDSSSAENSSSENRPSENAEQQSPARQAESMPPLTADNSPVETTDADPHTEEPPARSQARLVIILDDIGNNAESGRRALALPGAVTYAVLPYTPHGRMLAEMAHESNREVMLHAPMSNLGGMALGQGGLTLALSEDEFVDTLRGAIADIPHIVGVNNHTGSELTAAHDQMQWVMKELKAQSLYFVDSLTTGLSVAEKTAVEHQVPALRRHVFLDNETDMEAIHLQFQRALKIAREQGFAVAIGHPYPETLAYLEQAIPELPALGVELVPVSNLMPKIFPEPRPEQADAEQQPGLKDQPDPEQ